MADIWKKCLTNPGRMRIVFALLYLLTAFGIPLAHTYQLADKDIHHDHLECLNRLLHNDSYVKVQSATAFEQNGLTKPAESHDLYCPACLYSLTSKIFKSCSSTSMHSTQTVVRVQVLPQFCFIKQLEWFCSAPLRAPPCMTS